MYAHCRCDTSATRMCSCIPFGLIVYIGIISVHSTFRNQYIIKDAFICAIFLVLLLAFKIIVDVILGMLFALHTYIDTAFVIWSIIERVAQVYLYYSVARVYMYLYKNKQYIIVRPFWLLIAFTQKCSLQLLC